MSRPPGTPTRLAGRLTRWDGAVLRHPTSWPAVCGSRGTKRFTCFNWASPRQTLYGRTGFLRDFATAGTPSRQLPVYPRYQGDALPPPVSGGGASDNPTTISVYI